MHPGPETLSISSYARARVRARRTHTHTIRNSRAPSSPLTCYLPAAAAASPPPTHPFFPRPCVLPHPFYVPSLTLCPPPNPALVAPNYLPCTPPPAPPYATHPPPRRLFFSRHPSGFCLAARVLLVPAPRAPPRLAARETRAPSVMHTTPRFE